jgi:AraC family ethanolamine operon transcriptional activator
MSTTASAGRIATHDLEEHCQVLEPWELILRQMSPGRFHGQLNYVQINGILIYREHWSQRVMATGGVPAGYMLFGSPSASGILIDWCGKEIHPGYLAYAAASSEVDMVIPEGSDHVAVLVPERLLRGSFGEEVQHSTTSHDRHLECQQPLGNELVRMIQRVIDDFTARPGLLGDERLCNAVECQLLGTLAQIYIQGSRKARRSAPRERRLALRRAIKLSENLRNSITVPELAIAADASQRALEMAFRETLYTTPLRYLRWNRMNQVRRELLAGKRGSTTVRLLASDWGFKDMGRFAVDYKHLFGESPSTTLARSARPRPTKLGDILFESTNP